MAAWVRLNKETDERVVLLGQEANTLSAFTLEHLPVGWSFVRLEADVANAKR